MTTPTAYSYVVLSMLSIMWLWLIKITSMNMSGTTDGEHEGKGVNLCPYPR